MTRSIGVIGAGVMGVGVAQSLSQAGHRVVLVDVDPEPLAKVADSIGRALRFQSLFGKGKTDPRKVLERIECTTDYERLRDVSFVIENATEQWEVKRDIYKRLAALCRPEVVFAANTSAISITRIAAQTTQPQRVLGMHFMNPVPEKPTVEVIRGFHTSEAALTDAHELLASMGKRGIVVKDSPGFVSNRVLMLTLNEAIWLVADQVASPADIDDLFKSCFGHKMGPLETADLIGLDTILLSLEVLYDAFADSKYRPCVLLKTMVDAGLHGRKNGRGFYSYEVEP